MHPSHFRWSGIISAQELNRWVKGRNIGKLRSIRILRRSPAGNVNRIEFQGSSGRHVVYKEHLIRNILNRGSLRSTLFILETERDINGMPTDFYIYGGGWGHGVGLCQYGAVGRSVAGQTVNDILAHYYPGTYLKNLGY
jgi:SpoIID/LytB domain protein